MNDDDIEATDDPAYRAGLLVGRQRALADVIGHLMAQDDDQPEQQRNALVHWCTSAMETCRDEMMMVEAELGDAAA